MAEVISIVMAAGASTRMKSPVSKLLHSMHGKLIVERAFEQAKVLSHTAPIFVLGHQREEIVAALTQRFGDSSFIGVVQDPPLGTGDALRVALSVLENVADHALVFVMGGDAVCLKPESLKKLVEEHEQKKAVMSFLTARLQDPSAYGRVIRNSAGQIQKIVEFKNASESEKIVNEVNAGFYLFRAGDLKNRLIRLQKNSLTGEFYLTDLIEQAIQDNQYVLGQELSDWTESLGVNTQGELAFCSKVLQQRINQKWMSQGVCLEQPESIFISDETIIEAGVRVGPNCHLKGKNKISLGVEILANCVLENVLVSANTKIHEFCHLKEAEVGERCELGPYARLRPETKLDQGVKIGNFVEIKKSYFAEGSKANHLSYVGDSKVGRNTNIGAGTITCNYDGYNKAQTELGDNVFIGSNSALVAPVKIGKGAIVGAGAVITQDVPENAIALVRAEQKNLEQAAVKFREKRLQS